MDVTIDPFYPSPGASFEAYPWPTRCEYFPPGPGYLPTTITANIYLDGVLVSSGSRFFPTFPGGYTTPWQELASYPVQPRMIWEVDKWDPPLKVLLHKHRTDDTSGFGGYYSIYQQPQNTSSDPPVLLIAGSIEENAVNVVRDVWLRIIDPPSQASYEAPFTGDNQDPAPQLALYYFDQQGTRIDSVGGVLHLQSNQDTVPGRVRVYLETSKRYAGENYALEAAFEPTFACAAGAYGNTCARTTTYTTWKRVYVERDSMFRSGTLLKSSVGGGPTSSVDIPVVDKAPFAGASRTSPIPVVFVHAPNYDGSPPRLRYLEYRNVIKASGTGSRQTITVDQPLLNTYGVDATSDITPSLPDGVGVYTPTTLSQLYFPDTTLAVDVFATAFVEYVILDGGPGKPNGVVYIPRYASVSNLSLREALAKKWCDVCDGGLPANHQYLAGVSTTTPLGFNSNGTVGETFIDNLGAPSPFSFDYIQEMENIQNDPVFSSCPPSIATWTKETTAHELVHGWDVNPVTDVTFGHCVLRAWNSTSQQPADCGMRRGDPSMDTGQRICDRFDGAFALHAWSDPNCEYKRIRSQPEPMPQTHQR